MVLLGSTDAFFGELEQMFALCKERGAGTVYVTLKKVQVTGREVKGAKGGRRAGWLARAKISNKKSRKISASVPEAEVEQFSERLGEISKSAPISTVAGGTKKRGRKLGDGSGAGPGVGAKSSKRGKGDAASARGT